jgi:MscS family membrane protein
MRTSHRAAVLAAAALSAGMALAQIPGLSKPSAAPSAAPSPSLPADSPATYADNTPRGALYHFIMSARRVDYVAAATHLDLSDIPDAERAEQGPILARHLKVVLDRNLWFDFDKISDRPEGDLADGLPPNAELLGSIQSTSGPVEVVMRRIREGQDTTVWKFSRSLVARIPALYDEFGQGWLGDHVPERLHRMRAWNLEAWQAIGLLILVVLVWLVGWVGSSALARFAKTIVRSRRTRWDVSHVDTIRRPVRWAIGLVLLVVALPGLHLSLRASLWIDRLVAALAFVTAIILVASIADAFAQATRERLEREGQKSGAGVVSFVNRIVKVLLACIAGIGILQALGFNVTGLLAGLGIGGIAVALAAQKTIENLFGGLTLMADKPVKLGDFCRFGDKSGWVENIGFRSTRVRTLDRTVISVPNSEFSSVQIENLSERDRIRLFATIGLRYETTADQLRAVLVELRKLFLGHPRVAADMLRIRFIGFGASSLDIEIQSYVMTADPSEFYAIREDLLLRMMDVVAASGSGFAFPSRTIYMAKDDGLDPAGTRASEERIRALRAQGKLPFPDFPPDEAGALTDRLDYPPEGSSSAIPPVTPS